MAITRNDDGSLVDLTLDDEFTNLLLQRADLKTIERAGAKAEEMRKVTDAQIIQRMGNAAKARFRSALITAPTVRVKEAVRKAYTYRRITVKGDEALQDRATSSDDVEG